MLVQPFGDEKPLIEYPCAWSYRIIGTSVEVLQAALGSILGDTEHRLEASNTSRTGKYVAYRLTLVVQTEEQRLEIGRQLRAHDAILYVL